MNRRSLDSELNSLVIFRSLLDDEIIKNFQFLLGLETDEVDCRVYNYSDFVSLLYKENVNFSEYILKRVLENENLYIEGKAAGKQFDPVIESAVENELKILQELSQVTSADVKKIISYDGFLPEWKTTPIDLISEYRSRLENVGQFGYGKFAKNAMFMLRKGEITPVKHPDPQRLSDLYGYKMERQAVINNTLALLKGKPAQNVLLYGDAGTGKSSTVKAVVNEFADKGLRLIEITKEQLRDIPDIIESISSNPLKFIIFIDDLSFVAGEDCFGALKATLEGSVSARTGYTAINATSNRRHLVKETMADRSGDDLHAMDTRQELMRLSARFGLPVTFQQPDKDRYDRSLLELAKQYNVQMPSDQLFIKGAAFALRAGGRSPRVAKQFVELLAAGVKV